MRTITLTQIKKEVLAAGGSYRKLKVLINDNDAYEVNGKTLTRPQLIECFKNGAL